MMRKNKIWMLLICLSLITFSCQRNYYSGKAKGKDCGCPNTRSMSGY